MGFYAKVMDADKFKPGDIKIFEKTVTPEDTAAFEAGLVHPVYATFALGRDAEWACRLFVLEMKDPDEEEGIGTFLHVDHHSPALVGQTVRFTATLKHIIGNHVVCTYQAHVNERLIAAGETGQKILRKEKLVTIFGSIN